MHAEYVFFVHKVQDPFQRKQDSTPPIALSNRVSRHSILPPRSRSNAESFTEFLGETPAELIVWKSISQFHHKS